MHLKDANSLKIGGHFLRIDVSSTASITIDSGKCARLAIEKACDLSHWVSRPLTSSSSSTDDVIVTHIQSVEGGIL